jgi:hypothetical protein
MARIPNTPPDLAGQAGNYRIRRSEAGEGRAARMRLPHLSKLHLMRASPKLPLASLFCASLLGEPQFFGSSLLSDSPGLSQPRPSYCCRYLSFPLHPDGQPPSTSQIVTPATAMTVRATHFTPEILLSAPRRSGGVPNSQGSQVLYTVSTYDFESHKSQSKFEVLDVLAQEARTLSKASGVSEINWLKRDGKEVEVLFLVPGSKKGWTAVKVGTAGEAKSEESIEAFEKRYVDTARVAGPPHTRSVL